MGRGGYRPGAGRKPGAKDTKLRKNSAKGPESEEKQKIKQMLSFDKKAKARFYQEFMVRVSKGEKLSTTEKKLMDKYATELMTDMDETGKVGSTADLMPSLNLDPLTYMLNVMNDQEASPDRRDRMAIASAPFIHSRKGEGLGKKEEKGDKAANAAKGKFRTGRAPLALVK